MTASFLPISALPEIAKRIDGAERVLKADIARTKKLLADRAATLPLSIAEVPLQEAKDSLNLLAAHSRQLTHWQTEAITDAERVEVVRLRAIIAEIRPLVHRSIALAPSSTNAPRPPPDPHARSGSTGREARPSRPASPTLRAGRSASV